MDINSLFSVCKYSVEICSYERFFSETSQEVIDALRMFGFSSFRQGQESAIMRVLCGQFSAYSLAFI